MKYEPKEGKKNVHCTLVVINYEDPSKKEEDKYNKR